MRKCWFFIGIVLGTVGCQSSHREWATQSSGSSQTWLTKNLAHQMRVAGTIKECGEKTAPPVLKMDPNGQLIAGNEAQPITQFTITGDQVLVEGVGVYLLSDDQEVAQALAHNEACLQNLTPFIQKRKVPQSPKDLENLAVYYKGELAEALKQAVQPLHPTLTDTAIATAGGASALVSAANTGTAWGEATHIRKIAKSVQNLRRLGHMKDVPFKVTNDKVRARIAEARPVQAKYNKAMKTAVGPGLIATGLFSYLVYNMNWPTNVQVRAHETRLLEFIHMGDRAFRDHLKAHPEDANFVVRVVQTWSH